MTKPMIIAEIGSVHDGSFGNAIKLIELAKSSGADIVKFQMHIAEEETIRNAPEPPYFKGEPRYEYFERTSFTTDKWIRIKKYCDSIDIEFLCSPFSNKAVDILEKLNVRKFKIASGEVTNLPLIEHVARTKKPILISSGMSTWEELDDAISLIKSYHKNICLLQCTSEYPCSYDNVGLNIIKEMKKRYNIPVGFSDHTLTNYAAFAATILGVEYIEKHLTFSKLMYGSDAKNSSEPAEFSEMVTGIKAISKMLSRNNNKDENAKTFKKMKQIFEKSIVSIMNIEKGEKVSEKMLGIKKPGSGIPAKDIDLVVGKIANKNIKADSLINFEDLKDA